MGDPANESMTAGTQGRITIEVTVDSVQGAVLAERAGADRIELCQSLGVGGVTPSAGLFAAVRQAVALAVVVLIRPRGGDFLYGDDERDVMLRDIRHVRDGGADGIVTGALTAAGEIDRDAVGELQRAADPLPVTFHRAFDLARDAAQATDALCALGVARLLTSGQAATALAGAATIRAVHERAAGRLSVIAGAGVRDDHVAELVRTTGVREVHLSATAWRDSAMTFRRPAVAMGSTVPDGEYALRCTDPARIARVVATLRGR